MLGYSRYNATGDFNLYTGLSMNQFHKQKHSEKRLLILSTGGTLGMRPGETDGSLQPDQVLSDLMTWVPELKDYAAINVEIVANLDSSLIEPPLWLKLAHRIEKAQMRGECDGVVILHGTDTLAFTASSLSFLLLNLAFPVVLTGAQRPLAMTRTDARNNILGAVESSLDGPIEVQVFFNNNAFRGNRVTKIAIGDFHGFDSPNYPALGRAGMDWIWTADLFWPTTRRPTFWRTLPDTLPAPPLVVPWVPGLDFPSLEAGLMKQWGLVLEAFGAGNLPLSQATRDLLAKFIGAGGVVAIRSQVLHGSLALNKYAPGKAIRELSIAECHDMTREATVTKLMVLKSLGLDSQTMVQKMPHSLAGELTAPS